MHVVADPITVAVALGLLAPHVLEPVPKRRGAAPRTVPPQAGRPTEQVSAP